MRSFFGQSNQLGVANFVCAAQMESLKTAVCNMAKEKDAAYTKVGESREAIADLNDSLVEANARVRCMRLACIKVQR